MAPTLGAWTLDDCEALTASSPLTDRLACLQTWHLERLRVEQQIGLFLLVALCTAALLFHALKGRR